MLVVLEPSSGQRSACALDVEPRPGFALGGAWKPSPSAVKPTDVILVRCVDIRRSSCGRGP